MATLKSSHDIGIGTPDVACVFLRRQQEFETVLVECKQIQEVQTRTQEKLQNIGAELRALSASLGLCEANSYRGSMGDETYDDIQVCQEQRQCSIIEHNRQGELPSLQQQSELSVIDAGISILIEVVKDKLFPKATEGLQIRIQDHIQANGSSPECFEMALKVLRSSMTSLQANDEKIVLLAFANMVRFRRQKTKFEEELSKQNSKEREPWAQFWMHSQLLLREILVIQDAFGRLPNLKPTSIQNNYAHLVKDPVGNSTRML